MELEELHRKKCRTLALAGLDFAQSVRSGLTGEAVRACERHTKQAEAEKLLKKGFLALRRGAEITDPDVPEKYREALGKLRELRAAMDQQVPSPSLLTTQKKAISDAISKVEFLLRVGADANAVYFPMG